MKHFTFIFSALLVFSSFTFGQDLIIKKNGDEIKAKVLEVALSIVKYKKFDNLTGPTYEMLKSEVFMIKYENGTKDVINEIETPKNQPSIIVNEPKKTVESKEKIDLAFTEKHKSTSLFYGVSALFGLGGFSTGDASFDFNSYAVGPISLIFNRALSNKFSINFGPSAMYYRQSYSYTERYWSGNTWRTRTVPSSSNLILAAASVGANYHFATTKKIDPYAGISAGLGYYYLFGGGESSGTGSLNGTIPVIYGLKFGINILNKKQNAWAFEFGYDYLSYLKFGYTFIKTK